MMAKFNHDKPVLRIGKSLFSPLGSNVSRLGPCLLLVEDFTLSIPAFSKIPNAIIEDVRFFKYKTDEIK